MLPRQFWKEMLEKKMWKNKKTIQPTKRLGI